MPTTTNDVKATWIRDVRELLRAVEGWAGERGWAVSHEKEAVEEAPLGAYDIEVLTLDAPDGRIVLEPVARYAAGGEGRVDMYVVPSMHRFMVVRSNGGWRLTTDGGVPWPKPWGKETFLDLADELFRSR